MAAKKQLKDKGILIRVSAAQKATLAEAAKMEGVSLSSWMLRVSLREAQKVMNAQG
jgi:uncharacterized protein (DUF1778 family)